MTNLWVTFSADSSGSFIELSGNIIYNLNNLYNFNGNILDTTSDFIIHELTNNPIQSDVSLQANNWKQLNLNTILNPFQGYWLGGINTNLPSKLDDKSIITVTSEWINNPIPVTNIYGLIENWDVRNVTNMNNIFTEYSDFNRNISNWDTGKVTNMVGMFDGATSFNGNISNWNVGNVTNMEYMFHKATSFNEDISNWDVGNVTTMVGMFSGATSFNGNISNWDVGNVTDGSLNEMFKNVDFFINMSDKIHPNGTPYNYFISQRNNPNIPITVTLKDYTLLYNYSGYINQPTLRLEDDPWTSPDNNFDRIKNALSITSMNELINYSFSSSNVPTSRDILSIIQQHDVDHIYYELSGTLTTNYVNRQDEGPYTVTFTRRS